jgi:cytochrome c peroxidase
MLFAPFRFFLIISIAVSATFLSSALDKLSGEVRAQQTGSTVSKPLLKHEAIKPIPRTHALDPQKTALGKKLFNDTRFSKDDTVACVSCHNLSTGGTDRLERSVGIGGARGAVNAPTVFNSGFNFVQFWDGRARTLEKQMDGPIHNPKELGSSWSEILSKLKRDPALVSAFKKTYKDAITIENVQDAIAIFERSLTTPDSRFDQYLRGDSQSITSEEKAGYKLFKTYGCIACHQGINVGGNMYAKIGVVGDYLADRGNPTKADNGRFNITGRERDRHLFKVPSLRNVALTPPYFYDGSAKTLSAAVRVMIKYQLGRTAKENDIERIVAFLKTLTGKYQGTALWP